MIYLNNSKATEVLFTPKLLCKPHSFGCFPTILLVKERTALFGINLQNLSWSLLDLNRELNVFCWGFFFVCFEGFLCVWGGFLVCLVLFAFLIKTF